MKTLFLWLDAHPGFYWATGGLATLLLLGWIVMGLGWNGRPMAKRKTEWLLPFLVLSTLVAWRWPALLEVTTPNVREAQLVAAAVTLDLDPLPFRMVDLLDSGPLAALALLPLHRLGIHQDYFNARLTALLLDGASLLMMYGLLRSIFSASIAALGLLPGVLIVAAANDPAIIGYTPAHLAVFLATVAAWTVSRAHAMGRVDRRRSLKWWILSGLCAGLLPWTSAGAVGVMLLLVLWAVGLEANRTPGAKAVALKGPAWMAIVALYIVAAGAAFLHGKDQGAQFWTSYVVYNFARGGFGTLDEAWKGNSAHDGAWLGLAAVSLVTILPRVGWLAWRRRWPSAFEGSMAGFTVAAGLVHLVTRGEQPGPLWIALPWFGWVAASTGELWRSCPSSPSMRGLASGFAALAVVIPLALHCRQGTPPIFGHFAAYWKQSRDEIGRRIARAARGDDSMAVWGCEPQVAAESRLWQAVRSAVSTREIDASPERDAFFRPRYLSDVEAHQPMFFVDTVGPGAARYEDRARSGHETFPALANYIQARYTLMKDTGALRLYLRSDRLVEQNLERPGVVPLTLEGMTTATAKVPVRVFNEVSLFAHAPSVLAHPVPTGARVLRGQLGFFPDAYANPKQATDGAMFAIDLVDAHGRRTRRYERWVKPVENPGDRGKLDFVVELAPDTTGVELTTSNAGTEAFDWTYWSSLRFEGEGIGMGE